MDSDPTPPNIPRPRTAGATPRDTGARRRKLRAVVLLALTGIVSVTVTLGLIYWSLSDSPEEIAPGYALPFASFPNATLVPGEDMLLVSADGVVGLYVPAGAYMEPATFILTPRPADITPQAIDSETARVHPYDVWMLLSDGQLAGDVFFESPVLFCYWLDKAADANGGAGRSQARIQRFDPNANADPWIDLPAQGGWEPGQVCAALEHLSLFALALPRVAPELTPSVPHSVPTEPYAIPTS